MPLSAHDQQLFHAIQAQDMQVAQQAVQAGANIQVQTPEGTPLHAAVKVKHLGLVQWLVEQGAEITLTDAVFKTPIEIAAASKQADILAYLLAHRPALSASQLNYILMACVAKHPTHETEDYRVDTQLVNFIVSRLTRLNVHALLTTNRNWERVIVQLFSIKGEKRKDTVLSEGASAEQLKKEGAWVELEGWRQHEFLAIRIRALFELYLRISVEDMRKQALYPLLPQATVDANVAAILNALQQELLTTIETLATYHDALAIKNFVPSKRIQLRQAIARNVTAKVQALADGREYPLACGWGDAKKGHALYVSFMVYPQHIVPRIDNTDANNNQDTGKSYHQYIKEQRPRDDQAVTKLLPYVPGQWDKLETQPIQNYVEALLEAIMAGKAESFAKIYQPAVEPLTVSLSLPGTQIQTIGNCPVKNHHVGLHIRLKDKAFYRWVRREESKIIINLHAAKDQPLDIAAYWVLWQANLTVEATPNTTAFHLQTHLLRSLKASYAKHGYINRLFSAYTNHQEDSLAINKSYIHLAITPEETQRQKEQQVFKSSQLTNTAQLSQAIYEHTETVDVQQLFESAKAQGKQQIAVIGRPGVGKSTFCQYVALQWAEGAEWLSQFQWLFWIEARNLKSAWYEKKNYYELIDIVARECFNRPLSNLEAAILQQAIDQNRVLWLIDGHDALVGQTLPANLDEIVESLLAKAPLLMTSRPLYLKLAPTFFRVEIIGFTPDDIKEYVEHFFTTLKSPQSEKAHQLLSYMQQNPYAWELGRLPLQLELLCSIYLNETLQGNQALTQTELYQKIMVWLLRRYLIERKKVKSEDIDDDKHVEWLCRDVLRLLKQLAFDEFQKGNTILSQNAINQYRTTFFKTLSPPEWLALKRELVQLGLFTKAYRDYDNTNPNDADYYFIHPTFQEFIVAWVLAEQLEKQPPLVSFKPTGQETISLENFIAEYKYHPRFNIIWPFMAGFLREKSNFLNEYFNILLNAPIDIVGLYHITLMIHCLNESKLAPFSTQNRVINSIIVWINAAIPLGKSAINDKLLASLRRCQVISHYEPIKNIFLNALTNPTHNDKKKRLNKFASILFIQEIKINGSDIIKALKKCSLNKDKTIKRSATIALINLGYIDSRLFKRFIEIIIDEDEIDRGSSIKALSHVNVIGYKKYVLDKLAPILLDNTVKRTIQLAILEIFSILSKDYHDAIKILITVLNGCNDWVIKLSIAITLIKIGGTDQAVVVEIFSLFKEISNSVINALIQNQHRLLIFVPWIERFLGFSEDKINEFVNMLPDILAKISMVDIAEIRSFCLKMQIKMKKLNNFADIKNNEENYELEKDYNLFANNQDNLEYILERLENGILEEQIFSVNTLRYFNDPDKKLTNILLTIIESSGSSMDLKYSCLQTLRNFNNLDRDIFYRFIALLAQLRNENLDFIMAIEKTLTSLVFNSDQVNYYIELICQGFEKSTCYIISHVLATILNKLDLSAALNRIATLYNPENFYLEYLLASTPLKALLEYTIAKQCIKYYSVIYRKALENSTVIYTYNNQLFVYEEQLFYKIPINNTQARNILSAFQQEHSKIYKNNQADQLIHRIEENRLIHHETLQSQKKILQQLDLQLTDYQISTRYKNLNQQEENYADKICLYNLTARLLTLTHEFQQLHNQLLYYLDANPLSLVSKTSLVSTESVYKLRHEPNIFFQEVPILGDGWCALYAVGFGKPGQSQPEQILETLQLNLHKPAIAELVSQSLENTFQASLSLNGIFDLQGHDNEGEPILAKIKQLYYQIQQANAEFQAEANAYYISYLLRPDVLTAYLNYLIKTKYADAIIAQACLFLIGKKLAVFINYDLANGRLVNYSADGTDISDPNTVCIVYYPSTNPLLAHYNTLDLMVNHTFIFHTANAQTVHLAGDFNQWLDAEHGKIKRAGTDTYLMKQIELGVWEITIPLSTMRTHEFKYVVNGGERWENAEDKSQYPLANANSQNPVLTMQSLPIISSIQLATNLNFIKTENQPSINEDSSTIECKPRIKKMEHASEQVTNQKHKEEMKSFVSNVIYSGNPVFSKKPVEMEEAKQVAIMDHQYQGKDGVCEEANNFRRNQSPSEIEEQVFSAQEEIIDQDFFNQFDDDFDDDDLDITIAIRYKI